MAHSTTRARGIVRTRIAAFAIVMVALLGTTYALMPADLFRSGSPASQAAAKPPLCPGAKQVVARGETKVQLELAPHCVTGTIRVPVGYSFRLEAPGWREWFFWSGDRFRFEDDDAWMGDVPHSVFQLRGKKGQAILFVYPPKQ